MRPSVTSLKDEIVQQARLLAIGDISNTLIVAVQDLEDYELGEKQKRVYCFKTDCTLRARGVLRGFDGFICEAACGHHGETDTSPKTYDHWGDVFGPFGPVHDGGVAYSKKSAEDQS